MDSCGVKPSNHAAVLVIGFVAVPPSTVPVLPAEGRPPASAALAAVPLPLVTCCIAKLRFAATSAGRMRVAAGFAW